MPPEGGSRVYHSALLANGEKAGTIGAGSVIEHSILGSGTKIGRGCVVSQALAVRNPLRLTDNLLFFQVPLCGRDGVIRYAQVLCGVEDDFKGRYDGGQCVYLNSSIDEWMHRHGVTARDLWAATPADQRTLWTARLFLATEDRDQATLATWMAGARSGPAAAIRQWRRSPRYSMAMLLDQADPASLIEHREIVAAHLQTKLFLRSIELGEDRPMDTFIGHYGSMAAYESSLWLLAEFSRPAAQDWRTALRQARARWSMAQLFQRPERIAPGDVLVAIESAMAGAFAKIAEASEIGMRDVRAGPGGAADDPPGSAN